MRKLEGVNFLSAKLRKTKNKRKEKAMDIISIMRTKHVTGFTSTERKYSKFANSVTRSNKHHADVKQHNVVNKSGFV